MGSSREGLLTGAGVGFHGLEEAWTAQEEGVTRRCGGAARTHKYQDDAGQSDLISVRPGFSLATYPLLTFSPKT